MPMRRERSPDTDNLIRVLYGVNDKISDEQLAKRAGITVERMKQIIHSALKALERDYNIRFGRITKYGYKRMDDEDRVKSTFKTDKHLHRQVSREEVRIDRTNPDNLSMKSQHVRSAQGIKYAMLRQQTKMKMNPEEQTKPKPAPTPLPNIEDLIKKPHPFERRTEN